MPRNITVPATSAQGAVVTYTPPHGDRRGGDTSALPSRAANSGTTFAIGTTTVTCTATDNDDSKVGDRHLT